MVNARDRLRMIIRTKSISYGDFVLASGKKSNIYIDIKRISLLSDAIMYISSIICDIIEKEFPDALNIGGMELGAVPIVSGVSFEMGRRGKLVNGFIVRKNKKEHGISKWLDGAYDNKSPSVIVEDVITTGKTVMDAVKRTEEEGLNVKGIISVVDREEGGKEFIEKNGYPLISIFKISELIVGQQ